MPSQVDIEGHPTWVDDRGCPGVPRLLLPGGLSNIDELLNSIRTGLGERFHVAAIDRRGHMNIPRTPMPIFTMRTWQPRPFGCSRR